MLTASLRNFMVFGFAIWASGLVATPALAGSTKSPVELLEFRDLVDSSREKAVKTERFRVFRRRQEAQPTSQGRRVPIKAHLPSSGGPFPVVLISHGAGGNWDTHFAQADDLASHGYAVFCLEHTGSNTDRMKSSLRVLKNLKDMIHDSTEVLARPKDISFAINQLTEWNRSHPQLKGRLDLGRIGVLGHSFGAYTVMAVAGMRPALDWIEPKIAPGTGVGPDLSDPRVKCAVALSPQAPGDPFFLKESYRSLRVPLLGISGTRDRQSNGDEPAARLRSFELWPKSDGKNAFVWITDAGHLDFTDSSGGDEQGRPSAGRADVQRVVRAATLLFFDQCLRGKGSTGAAITEEALKPTWGGAVKRVEVFRK
ncbi:MAG: alpha/beta fold hydrolase [Bdellovibrionales bacterium]|nr:alpha/beta fold hydrolase [Bdellovibrionales bacterium]